MRGIAHTDRRNGGVKLWLILHLQTLCVLLLLLTWWGRLTVWCVWQRYWEHHTLRFWSGLIMEPPPRSPANPHPVTCRGKRSVQVTSQLTRQVTHDYLYLHRQTNMAARTLHPLASQCMFQIHAFTRGCTPCAFWWTPLLRVTDINGC